MSPAVPLRGPSSPNGGLESVLVIYMGQPRSQATSEMSGVRHLVNQAHACRATCESGPTISSVGAVTAASRGPAGRGARPGTRPWRRRHRAPTRLPRSATHQADGEQRALVSVDTDFPPVDDVDRRRRTTAA